MENTTRKVWDLPVRIFHWSLLAAVIGAYLTNRLGVTYFRYHVWCGYAVLVLVCFRILWGLLGTRHARFRHFLRGPLTTARYGAGLLRGSAAHMAGHNPLGALMVVLLLAMLLTQAVTGLFGNDEIFNFGPLYGYVSNARSLALTSLHRRLFYWILAAIALHVMAVAYHRYVKGERLVVAMWHGRKPAALVPDGEEIRSSRLWLAVLLVAVLCAVLAWVVHRAPVPVADPFN
ncbi:MAG TPA: cytochrome b/b6 domain-containing protein [Steroidobacteraceae bacterium]|nr:cytochrome b/b6 domain-containing protein [Steroidobacteraceae bacterium]